MGTRRSPNLILRPVASFAAGTKHYVRDENTVNANTDYYAHGGLVAWYLDLLLRGWDPDGDGLDEVFRLLWKRHANTDEGYTEDDVLAALRRSGILLLEDVHAAILETNGAISVIEHPCRQARGRLTTPGCLRLRIGESES
jgi:predicted metalloprotease with PDZ domain